jgi:hypothetical protein
VVRLSLVVRVVRPGRGRAFASSASPRMRCAFGALKRGNGGFVTSGRWVGRGCATVLGGGSVDGEGAGGCKILLVRRWMV